MLKVNDLVVKYGMIEAIKGISFEVPNGKIVTLIGANGAGKTTTMHTISGLLKPASGSIYLDDKDITHLKAHEIVKLGICVGYISLRKSICRNYNTRTMRTRIKNISGSFS